jgi:acyl carrier protein
MELKVFIKMFAEQFEDTELSEFSAETHFRDLEEWSSLTGLAILNVISKKCNVILTPEELRNCNSVQEVYELIKSKQ